MIVFACQCGKQLKAPDEFAGRQTRCPGCGQNVTVPAASAGIQATPPPVAGQQIEPQGLSQALAKPQTSHQAIASLGIGLLSIVLPCLSGIPAIVMGLTWLLGLLSCSLQVLAIAAAVTCGFLALSAIKRSQGQLGGKGLAIGGMVTAFVSLLIFAGTVGTAGMMLAVSTVRYVPKAKTIPN